jgi:hypothetical protein
LLPSGYALNMYDRRHRGIASDTSAARRAVDSALAVIVQTEWLASRPTIPLIVTPDLDVPSHVRKVAFNVHRLANDLDRALEDDEVRHHQSSIVDAIFVIAVQCRLFVSRWAVADRVEASRFNVELRSLRNGVDKVLRSMAA